MIVSTIQNRKRYYSTDKDIQAGLDFLTVNDLESLKPGKYPIDGDHIFALVQEYTSKEENESKLEGHQLYIDIQYVVSGSERIGYLERMSAECIENYNPEKDVEFFSGDCSWIKMSPGTFCILYPEDLHKPGVKTDISSPVKKVVVKIHI